MMDTLTLEELKNCIEGAAGAFDVVYIHWTAGSYNYHPDDYHINIDDEGTIYRTKDFREQPAATWHRNYRSLAIAIDCCKDAALYGDGHADFGDCPPTDAQIECLAQVIAVISDTLHLPIRKSLFMTHAEAAELDDYGPNTTCERWDLWVLPGSTEWGSGGDYIRGKALFYQDQWKE